jgi:hypothetical protein
MKAVLSLIFISLLSLTAAFSQEVRIIELEYSTAVRPDNARVKVHISRDTHTSYSVRVESVSTWLEINPNSLKPETKPTEKRIAITEGQFQALVTSLQKIRPTDIIGGPHPSLLDGASCSIYYGANGTGITYHVNTPDYETDERNLNKFLDAYKLILRTAELDPEKIL